MFLIVSTEGVCTHPEGRAKLGDKTIRGMRERKVGQNGSIPSLAECGVSVCLFEFGNGIIP